MKTILSRTVAIFLTLTLALPPPSFALRTQQAPETTQREWLTSALLSAGLGEPPFGLTPKEFAGLNYLLYENPLDPANPGTPEAVIARLAEMMRDVANPLSGGDLELARAIEKRISHFAMRRQIISAGEQGRSEQIPPDQGEILAQEAVSPKDQPASQQQPLQKPGIEKKEGPAGSSAAGLEENWPQRIREGYAGRRALVFGWSGFVGRRLIQSLAEQAGPQLAAVDVVSRREGDYPDADSPLMHKFTPHIDDLLNTKAIRRIVGENKSGKPQRIFMTAGLAWQHPPGAARPTEADLEGILYDELLMNGLSVLMVGVVMDAKDRLIVTSSNAIDVMESLAKDSAQKEAIRLEVAAMAKRYVNRWFLKIYKGENPTEKALRDFVRKDLADHPVSDIGFTKKYSYPYSMLLREEILKEVAHRTGKEIIALRISDVYGPGQSIDAGILNPNQAARRPQRFLAAFSQIARGDAGWIQQYGALAHGFTIGPADEISVKIRNDWVAPTYVADVTDRLLLRAGVVDLPKGKVVLEVSGPFIANRKLVSAIQEVVSEEIAPVKVTVQTDTSTWKKPVARSRDLRLLGLKVSDLTPLKEGLRLWVQSQAGLEESGPFTLREMQEMFEDSVRRYGGSDVGIAVELDGNFLFRLARTNYEAWKKDDMEAAAVSNRLIRRLPDPFQDLIHNTLSAFRAGGGGVWSPADRLTDRHGTPFTEMSGDDLMRYLASSAVFYGDEYERVVIYTGPGGSGREVVFTRDQFRKTAEVFQDVLSSRTVSMVYGIPRNWQYDIYQAVWLTPPAPGEWAYKRLHYLIVVPSVYAGLEETDEEKIRRILEEKGGFSSLASADVQAILWPGTETNLPIAIDLLAKATGITLDQPTKSSIVGEIRPLIQLTGAKRPDVLLTALHNIRQAQDWNQFSNSVIAAEQSIRAYLQTLPPDDYWYGPLQRLVEPMFYDIGVYNAMQSTSWRVSGAFRVGQADHASRSNELLSIARPAMGLSVIRQMMKMHYWSYPKEYVDYFLSAIEDALSGEAFTKGRFLQLPDMILVSSTKAQGSRARYAANTAHEQAHAELLAKGPGWWHQGPDLYADWLTTGIQVVTGEWFSQETGEPMPWPGFPVAGPIVQRWLYQQGSDLSHRPPAEFSRFLQELDSVSPGARRYLQGVAFGGYARGLGEQIARAKPGGVTYDARERALRFLAWYGLSAQNPSPAEFERIVSGFRTSHQLNPSAGLEAPVTPEGLLAAYGRQIREQDLLDSFEAFRAAGANRVIIMPATPMTESVVAYTMPEWVAPVDKRLKSDFVLTASYAPDGRVFPPAVLIRQTGADLPEPSAAIPIIELRGLADLESLTPGFVYTVAINRVLAGQVIGPVVGVLTFTDQQGQLLHAIFA
ncbi:MAG: hypothetical protein NC819_03015 [Candidatus Omnitrophica bacterium]|nr:hypothetical protein [Candidatus Omnitrophota bacterium]